MQPERACLGIGACVVLHNIAKLLNEEDFDGDDEDEEYECDPLPGNVATTLAGKAVRDHLANTFFA